MTRPAIEVHDGPCFRGHNPSYFREYFRPIRPIERWAGAISPSGAFDAHVIPEGRFAPRLSRGAFRVRYAGSLASRVIDC
jgi:hypothetical protein